MDVPNTFSRQQLEAIDSLRVADRRHLKCIFRDCQPPNMESLVGEFNAELLHQGGRAAGVLTKILFGTSGRWIGKAFCPTSAATGVGYNCFRQGPHVLPKLHMDTFLAASKLDSGQSLVINYANRNLGLIRWLRGEVRQVAPGVLLGIGMFGPRIGRRDRLRRKIPFVMVGPVRPYQLENQSAPFELRRSA